MNRKSHKIACAMKLQYPVNMIFVDTETTTLRPWESIHHPELIVGHAQFVRLNLDLTVDVIYETSFRRLYDYWVWFGNILNDVKELTVFAHNWSFDYPTLDTDKAMKGFKYTLKSITDGCPPIILNYVKDKNKVSYIDTMNYFQSSVKQMGEVIGAEKGDVVFDNKYSEKLLKYCKRDVVIIRESMLGLIRYLRDNDLSKLTHTVSSLALSTYVRRFKPCSIYIDGDKTRSAVGRASYFGGRTEAFKLGKFKEPLYLIDINSQYPFIMQSSKFPYRTLSHYKKVNLNDLIDVLDRYAVTAVVDIDTDIPAYPVKIDNRTCFPVGTFRTHLSTPEIEYAINHDHIKKVYSLIIYEQERLFYDYVNYFYSSRIKNRKAGNDVWSLLDKYLLNTLYGKFGQSHREWVKCLMLPKGFPHTDRIKDHDTGKYFYIMEINDEVFTSVKDSEARDSFPAIAAHVTAGARILLQHTMDFVGYKNVYYCDTDSLLLNQKGYDRIKPNLDNDRLGAWGFVDRYDDIEIFGAKDYRFGSLNKTKGIKGNAIQVKPGVYQQLQFATLRGCVVAKDLSHPIIRNVIKNLSRKYKKGIVNQDGSISPFKLTKGFLSS